MRLNGSTSPADLEDWGSGTYEERTEAQVEKATFHLATGR
jgi:hypothetical protein